MNFVWCETYEPKERSSRRRFATTAQWLSNDCIPCRGLHVPRREIGRFPSFEGSSLLSRFALSISLDAAALTPQVRLAYNARDFAAVRRRGPGTCYRSSLGDAKSSLGDAKSSLGEIGRAHV